MSEQEERRTQKFRSSGVQEFSKYLNPGCIEVLAMTGSRGYNPLLNLVNVASLQVGLVIP